MTNRAISVSDCLVLSKKMSNLQPELVKYVWRSDGGDSMLRTDLLGLRDEIDEILERSKRDAPHTHGTMA